MKGSTKVKLFLVCWALFVFLGASWSMLWNFTKMFWLATILAFILLIGYKLIEE